MCFWRRYVEYVPVVVFEVSVWQVVEVHLPRACCFRQPFKFRREFLEEVFRELNERLEFPRRDEEAEKLVARRVFSRSFLAPVSELRVVFDPFRLFKVFKFCFEITTLESGINVAP